MGNLFDDPERKLRKYLQGGKIEQSGEWHFEYDKDGQLTEKYKGSGKWWDTKRERWRYEWNQNGTLKAVKTPHRMNWVEFTYDALGRRLSKLASGTPAGNGRTTAGYSHGGLQRRGRGGLASQAGYER